MTNRRDLILTGLALAAVAAGWQIWIRRPVPLVFAEINGLAGWRKVETGNLSVPSGATFLTIGQGQSNTAPLAPDRLESTLYRDPNAHRIAIFSDFFCPFCRRLTARLASRSDLNVNWHELPLLGPASEIAAHASLAADQQGAYAPFVAALARSTFRPTQAHMGRVAESIGLDAVRLVRDMAGPDVADRLAKSQSAAATLGIYGTPGITIGRTLVMGEVTTDELDALIALEKV